MMRFRRNKTSRPVGAGLTYCAGFDLVVRADTPARLTIEIDQERSAGTDLRPPRRVASLYVDASPVPQVLRIETDARTLGHPCAEVFRFTFSTEASDAAEVVIKETQTLCEAQVIKGDGWGAVYPVFTGPKGISLEYRPLHGYLD